MAHTPGPWVIDIPNDNLVAKMVDDVYHYVADTAAPMVRIDYEECAANARLIAASPDLLAALKDMLSGWRYIREHHGDLYGVGWDRCVGIFRGERVSGYSGHAMSPNSSRPTPTGPLTVQFPAYSVHVPRHCPSCACKSPSPTLCAPSNGSTISAPCRRCVDTRILHGWSSRTPVPRPRMLGSGWSWTNGITSPPPRTGQRRAPHDCAPSRRSLG